MSKEPAFVPVRKRPPCRYFVDMDGVLAKYEFNLPSYDTLYEEGYFLNRPPQENIVDSVSQMLAGGRDVFVLSAVLIDSKYALFEKHEWLERHLPIDAKRRIFTICGEDKIAGVPAFDPDSDILIDDYGLNCLTWADHGGTYVKVSRDAQDAEYERTKHKYVIHPEMSVSEILAVIDRASEEAGNTDVISDEERLFDIEYRETYSEVYPGIEGRNFDEAASRLDKMLRSGEVEGPRFCDSSEFINRTKRR